MRFTPSTLLRYSLIGDAVASGATGALMAGGAGFLAELLGLPGGLLRYAGWVLLPYAALVGYLGTRPRLTPIAVWAVIGANLLWTLDSLFLLLGTAIRPTALGYAFVIGQALVVLFFAEAQYLGLRRSASASDPVPA